MRLSISAILSAGARITRFLPTSDMRMPPGVEELLDRLYQLYRLPPPPLLSDMNIDWIACWISSASACSMVNVLRTKFLASYS